MQLGEFELIQDLREFFRPRKKIIGIGDDCAVIEGNQMISVDALVENVHFKRRWISPEDVAYKAMAVGVSDLAAMGGYPEYALISLGISQNIDDKEVQAWIKGIEEAQEEFGFEIIGGDTVKSDKVFFSVTMIGHPFVKPLLRSGARKKDIIYVTGTLGDSRVGLECHFERDKEASFSKSELFSKESFQSMDKQYFFRRYSRPFPRVRFMEYVSRHVTIHACIDVSDGLLGDLFHIADESGTGFFVNSLDLPIAEESFGEISEKEREIIRRYALNGGEDYELLFTSPNVLDCVEIEQKTGVRLTPIGTILEENREVQINGEIKSASEFLESYRHF